MNLGKHDERERGRWRGDAGAHPSLPCLAAAEGEKGGGCSGREGKRVKKKMLGRRRRARHWGWLERQRAGRRNRVERRMGIRLGERERWKEGIR